MNFGAVIWNSIPLVIRLLPSRDDFKRALTDYWTSQWVICTRKSSHIAISHFTYKYGITLSLYKCTYLTPIASFCQITHASLILYAPVVTTEQIFNVLNDNKQSLQTNKQTNKLWFSTIFGFFYECPWIIQILDSKINYR